MRAPYSEGSMDSSICFIGEAPGANEVEQQRPFVGQAGQKLDQLLSRAGLSRGDCRFDNVIQERPPGNEIDHFINLSRTVPTITLSAQAYIEDLRQRMMESKANVFVPLGNVPLYVLTGLKEITKRRGSILPCTLRGLEGRKVIPTIHPAATVYVDEYSKRPYYMYEHFIANDLKRIRIQSAFPQIALLQRNLILDPSTADVLRFIEQCYQYETVAFDIEVSRNEISHISLAPTAELSICVPFWEGKDNYTSRDEAEIWYRLSNFLECPDVRKIGHNIVFDATFVFSKFGIRVGPVEDTMVAFGIAYPDFPKGLDFLTTIYCNGEPYYKDDGKRWYKNPYGDYMQFRRYSAMDAAVTAECFPKAMRDISRLGNMDTYKRQCALIEPLVFLGDHGIKMDKVGLKHAAENCAVEIKELEAELEKIVGFALNIRSPKQVKDYFYIRRGIKPYTKKGKATVDEKALQHMAAKGIREADIILKLRHLSKMQGTYFEVRLDEDARMRCSFNPVGTKQGRVSSSKTLFDTGANLQNQPDEMKRFMLPDAGMFFTTVDLSQAENRVVAYVANEPQMIYAFENGVDIHKQTAALIYGIPPEDVTKEQRQWGKRANHGLNYALGADTFARYYQVTREQAKFMIERYHTIYPGVREWHARIVNKLSQDRTLINCYGRTRLFMDFWCDELFKEAYSFIPQSTVADKNNEGGLIFMYKNQEIFHNAWIMNTIHDATLFAMPLSDMDDWYRCLSALIQELERPLSYDDRRFIIPVDTKVGLNALDSLEIKSAEFHSLSKSDLIGRVQRYLEEQEAANAKVTT